MIEAIFTGLALGVLLAVSIGPIIFAILKQSLVNGHKAGFVFVAGVSSSDIIIVLVCNLVSSLFNTALQHKFAIGVFGSIFLSIMGIYSLFFKKIKIDENGGLQEKQFNNKQFIAIFLSGFFINTLNPAVFIFWLAATSKVQTQTQNILHPTQYLIIVYISCLLFVLSTDIAKVLLAQKIRPKLTNNNLSYINKVSGVILLIFGLILGWNALHL
jgi:threonine/homoserine/homoserine lactone efflux protein